MRVLLMVSPYKFPTAEAPISEPLGILYLAASLRRNEHEVYIVDHTINEPKKLDDGSYYYGSSELEIENEIRAINPDAIGISCHYAFSREEAYRICSLAKEVNSHIITIIGGLLVSIYKGRVLHECNAIDYGLIGEAEGSLIDILSYISSKSPLLTAIDGLVYRDSGHEVVVNKKCDFILDLNSLCYPARDLVDIKKYMYSGHSVYGLGGQGSLSLLTSRSCPNQCVFCNMWLVHGKKWRPRTPDNVLDEIDEMVRRYQVQHIFIMDDNFTFNPERAKLICAGIIRKGYRFSWNTPNGISVRGMDAELASLMKKAGCKNVCVAIESGSEYIRNNVMKKNISNEQILTAIEHFNKVKMPIGGFFILGMPGENKFHYNETVEFVKKLPINWCTISFATPYPGTRLHSDLVEAGIIDSNFAPVIDTIDLPVFEMEDFTKEDLIFRKKKLQKEFYQSHLSSMLSDFLTGRLNWVNYPRKYLIHILQLLFDHNL